jgi:hypothetical protein
LQGARRLGGGLLIAAWFAVLVAMPGRVSAHVNRVVGPYTFLVVLVEEPYFATNHAGFEFWVHKQRTVVAGLDQTLHATAIGHGTTVELAISPLNVRGFYVVDRRLSGQPFDPKGGGTWSLRLTGTIEHLQVDETFRVTFPSYPRVGSVVAPSIGSAAPPTAIAWVAAAGAALILGMIGGLIVIRRRRLGV